MDGGDGGAAAPAAELTAEDGFLSGLDDARVSPEQAAAVLDAVRACPGELYAGVVGLNERGLKFSLGVLLTGWRGEPVSLWVLCRQARPGLRRVSRGEAATLAGVWLRLRRLTEVACAPAWCPSLPSRVLRLEGPA